MTEQVKQWICIKFCVKLEHSFVETIRMIQKAAAIGSWWLAASSWQRARSCITSSAEFFGNTSNHPGDSAPLEPRFGALWLLTFPKTKITFEGKDFRPSVRCRKIQQGNWRQLRELCEVPRCLLWRDWGVTVLCVLYPKCLMFLVSYIFNKCLYFSYYMAGCLLDRPCMFPGKIVTPNFMLMLYF